MAASLPANRAAEPQFPKHSLSPHRLAFYGDDSLPVLNRHNRINQGGKPGNHAAGVFLLGWNFGDSLFMAG
jgi:hypothetical protein